MPRRAPRVLDSLRLPEVERLEQLRLDRQHRVEPGQRALRHVADSPPADRPPGLLVGVGQVVAGDLQLAAGDVHAVARQRPGEAAAEHRLARARTRRRCPSDAPGWRPNVPSRRSAAAPRRASGRSAGGRRRGTGRPARRRSRQRPRVALEIGAASRSATGPVLEGLADQRDAEGGDGQDDAGAESSHGADWR